MRIHVPIVKVKSVWRDQLCVADENVSYCSIDSTPTYTPIFKYASLKIWEWACYMYVMTRLCCTIQDKLNAQLNFIK